MIKTRLPILFLLFIVISCTTNTKESSFNIVEDNYSPVRTAEQIFEELEFAFEHGELDLFRNVFAEWQKNIRPNASKFINQNDTISDIYKVFSAFLKHTGLLNPGHFEDSNELNSNSKYVVIQNKLLYYVLISKNISEIGWNKSRKNLISNFRPPFASADKDILYLTDEYDESINDFLVRANIKPIDEIAKHSENTNEKLKEYELLKDYIPVLLCQKKNYLHFEPYPYVDRIIFNKSITKAKIDFCLGSLTGAALLEKKGKNWVIIEYEMKSDFTEFNADDVNKYKFEKSKSSKILSKTNYLNNYIIGGESLIT